MSTTRKSIVVGLIAAFVTFILTVIISVPAKSATPADLDDVRYATTVGKLAWGQLDYIAQEDICDSWYIAPKFTRDLLAQSMRNNIDQYISVYDSKRAAYRVLNWAC